MPACLPADGGLRVCIEDPRHDELRAEGGDRGHSRHGLPRGVSARVVGSRRAREREKEREKSEERQESFHRSPGEVRARASRARVTRNSCSRNRSRLSRASSPTRIRARRWQPPRVRANVAPAMRRGGFYAAWGTGALVFAVAIIALATRPVCARSPGPSSLRCLRPPRSRATRGWPACPSSRFARRREPGTRRPALGGRGRAHASRTAADALRDGPRRRGSRALSPARWPSSLGSLHPGRPRRGRHARVSHARRARARHAPRGDKARRALPVRRRANPSRVEGARGFSSP